MKNKRLQKSPFTQTLLTVAISLALVPATSYAGLKPSDINGLPQTGSAHLIKSGKAGNGDSVFTWRDWDDKKLYGQRIKANGALDGSRFQIANFGSNFIGDYGLAVKNDGAFISAWTTDQLDVLGVTVANSDSDNLVIPFTVSASLKPSNTIGDSATYTHAFSKDKGFAIAWKNQYSVSAPNNEVATTYTQSILNYDEDFQPGVVEQIHGAALDAIAMDIDGDFFVVSNLGSSIFVTKNNDEQPFQILPSQVVTSYYWGEGANINKTVDFQIQDATIATNKSGDFVVVWSEIKSVRTRKPTKNCYTLDGERTCEDGFKYSFSEASNALFARRYSNTLQPLDANPVVIASSKKVGTYIEEPIVVIDDDGDFTVAYASGKRSYTPSADGEGDGTINDQGDVFVRQFTVNNKTGKFSADKAIKVSGSSKPKLATKHSLKNISNHEPNVVITDESTNAFTIMWRNDYQDWYKDYENSTEVCDKYKTTTVDGEKYKECVHYKSIPADAHNDVSTLKAKRYSN